MLDITFCPGEDCPIKEQCYRFTAEHWGRVDYFAIAPYHFQSQSCDYFMAPYRPSEADIRTRAYHIWQSWGCPDHKADECWFEAQRQLRRQ